MTITIQTSCPSRAETIQRSLMQRRLISHLALAECEKLVTLCQTIDDHETASFFELVVKQSQEPEEPPDPDIDISSVGGFHQGTVGGKRVIRDNKTQ